MQGKKEIPMLIAEDEEEFRGILSALKSED